MTNILHPPAFHGSPSLRQIADELLSPGAGDDGLRAAVTALYSLCSSVTGISENSGGAEDARETGLSSGKALSPRDAARCLLDFNRTSRFLRGVHAAILEARRRFPGTTVEILYAGCGPFAPLALPLTSRFSPADIRFTLLDIHGRSLEAARLLFQTLGAGAFVRDYVGCDAASYRHGGHRAVHIVLAEVMQAALEREPQVAVTMNLAPQLCPGGIFIPESIAVDCRLCDVTRELAGPLVEARATPTPAGVEGAAGASLGRVLELTAGSCRGLSAPGGGGGYGGAPFPPKVTLGVPEGLGGELHLMLSTTVTVFDSVTLGDYESGLTQPRVLCDLGKVRGGMRIEFAYLPGDNPGFRYRSV